MMLGRMLLQASNALLWTPSQISTSLWLDADDSASITQTSGAVSLWSDKSGNGKNATASSTQRPTTGTRRINSRNTLDFNGTSNVMALASSPMAGSTAGMAVFVAQLDADPPAAQGQAGTVLGGWGTTSQGEHFPFTDGVIYDGFLSNTRKIVGNPTPSMSSQPVICSVLSATNLWEMYINGSLLFSTTTNTYAVGSSPVLGFKQFYMDGRIAEIVAVNTTSSTTRQLLEGYVASSQRWNLQSLLPAGHPYKSLPPYV